MQALPRRLGDLSAGCRVQEPMTSLLLPPWRPDASSEASAGTHPSATFILRGVLLTSGGSMRTSLLENLGLGLFYLGTAPAGKGRGPEQGSGHPLSGAAASVFYSAGGYNLSSLAALWTWTCCSGLGQGRRGDRAKGSLPGLFWCLEFWNPGGGGSRPAGFQRQAEGQGVVQLRHAWASRLGRAGLGLDARTYPSWGWQKTQPHSERASYSVKDPGGPREPPRRQLLQRLLHEWAADGLQGQLVSAVGAHVGGRGHLSGREE